MNLRVGSKVRLLRAMLGERVGSIGFVYEEYNIGGHRGVSIIFSAGGYDGFSEDEQKNFLEYVEEDSRYSNYEFKNVMQLSRDYDNGYWKFT